MEDARFGLWHDWFYIYRATCRTRGCDSWRGNCLERDRERCVTKLVSPLPEHARTHSQARWWKRGADFATAHPFTASLAGSRLSLADLQFHQGLLSPRSLSSRPCH